MEAWDFSPAERTFLDELSKFTPLTRYTYVEEPVHLGKEAYFYSPHISHSGDILWEWGRK